MPTRMPCRARHPNARRRPLPLTETGPWLAEGPADAAVHRPAFAVPARCDTLPAMPSLPLFLLASSAYVGAAVSAARATHRTREGLLLAAVLALLAILLHAAGHLGVSWPLGLPPLNFY